MRRTYLAALPVIVVLLTALNIGCSGKAEAEKKLIGKWELDTEPLKAVMKAEMEKKAAEDPTGAMGAKFAAAMLDTALANMKVTMEFKEDGKISTVAPGQSQEGSWKVVSASGDKATLEISMDDKEPESGDVTFVGDDTIELEPPENQKGKLPPGLTKFTLKRVK